MRFCFCVSFFCFACQNAPAECERSCAERCAIEASCVDGVDEDVCVDQCITRENCVAATAVPAECFPEDDACEQPACNITY